MQNPGPLGPQGRLWLRAALGEATLETFDGFAPTHQAGARLQGGWTARLAPLCAALETQFGAVWPVRVVAFDKREASNWGVPWHRDEIVAVQERLEVDGYQAWSCKDGLWHCRPPRHVLQDMLFCRIFLDDVGGADGGMEIALGSHLQDHKTGEDPGGATETEIAKRGDVLVMDMRMVHRSRPADTPRGRRVLRVDLARAPLPEPLRWACP